MFPMWRRLAVVLVGGVVGVSGAGAATIPQRLVGQYSRRLTRAQAGTTGVHTGTWRLKIARSGVATLHHVAADFDVAPARITVSSTRIVFRGMTCATAGVYRWQVARKRLTLTKVKDACKPRVAVLQGTWQEI